MANNNTTTKNDEAANNAPFWGQPHHEGETFVATEFEQDFLKLYMDEPFLGGISIHITKTPDAKIPTACVGFKLPDGQLTLSYNPYFFRSMTAAERRGVICHELFHFALMHIFDRMVTDNRYARLWNVATDLAVNSVYLNTPGNKLPDFCLVPGVEPESKNAKIREYIKNANKLQASELYFEQMKEILEQQEGEGDGFDLDSMDDHGGWGELPDSIREELRDRARSVIRDGVRRAQKDNAWGSVSSQMRDEICRGLEYEVDWRSVIRMFFGNARSMERISSIKRVSRKIPGVIPGVKRGRVARFAFFIDQSGSMSDDDVALAFAEVEGASREVEIEVYNFDTEVDENSHKKWRRGARFPWCRTRCGGTNFDSVAEFVNHEKNGGRWQGVIILTDGYAPTMRSIRGAKVLWIITPGGTLNATRPGDLVVQLKTDKQVRTV